MEILDQSNFMVSEKETLFVKNEISLFALVHRRRRFAFGRGQCLRPRHLCSRPRRWQSGEWPCQHHVCCCHSGECFAFSTGFAIRFSQMANAFAQKRLGIRPLAKRKIGKCHHRPRVRRDCQAGQLYSSRISDCSGKMSGAERLLAGLFPDGFL